MQDTFLATNDNGSSVSAALSGLASHADEIHLAVAFLSTADPLESWLIDGKTVELIVALAPPTDPLVLRSLVSSFPVNLHSRFFSSRFHSKFFLFFKDGVPFAAQVGSSNLTHSGLHTNVETNAVIYEECQLDRVAEHFRSIWKQSADLEPEDLKAYENFCVETSRDRRALKRKEGAFERRIVCPRTRDASAGRIGKEATDYVNFWKTIDGIVSVVGETARKAWPNLPLYLSVDYFLDWVVKIWDREGIDRISNDPTFRRKRLPILFAEFVRWDKKGRNYSSELKRQGDYFRNVLARNRLSTLTPQLAQDIYGRLYSGRMRTQRFGADRTFASSNSLSKIKRAFGYLLWSDADIRERISALLPGGPYHLKGFGASNIQELLGWAKASTMPIRNDKSDAALDLLGFRFR